MVGMNVSGAVKVPSRNPEDKSANILRNRLLSIKKDAGYVFNVVNLIGNPPVVTNERCGSWYVRPELKTASVYFKSTDGHTGIWAFSTRRLNVVLLELLGKHGRCVVVDSARKRIFPDALSKTIPIWCTVMNRLMFPDEVGYHGLHTADEVVREHERRDIANKLDSFVGAAQKLPIDIASLQRSLKKPIKPCFCSSSTDLKTLRQLSESVNHVICLSASTGSSAEESETYTYVRGAGDDAENWGLGLTADLFWTHENKFIAEMTETAFEQQAIEIMQLSKKSLHDNSPVLSLKPVYVTTSSPPFYVASIQYRSAVLERGIQVDAIISCRVVKTQSDYNDEDQLGRSLKGTQSSHERTPVLTLHCPSGKLGSRALRQELHRIKPFLVSHFPLDRQVRLLFVSDSGMDLALGTALAVACLHFDERGQFVAKGVDQVELDKRDGKSFIRHRLVRILNELAIDDQGGEGGSGLRKATLTAVNEFVIGLKEAVKNRAVSAANMNLITNLPMTQLERGEARDQA